MSKRSYPDKIFTLRTHRTCPFVRVPPMKARHRCQDNLARPFAAPPGNSNGGLECGQWGTVDELWNPSGFTRSAVGYALLDLSVTSRRMSIIDSSTSTSQHSTAPAFPGFMTSTLLVKSTVSPSPEVIASMISFLGLCRLHRLHEATAFHGALSVFLYLCLVHVLCA